MLKEKDLEKIFDRLKEDEQFGEVDETTKKMLIKMSKNEVDVDKAMALFIAERNKIIEK